MEGKRVQQDPKKLGLIIAGTAAGVLLAGYLGLCAWVGASQQILPNVAIGTVEVGGMTRQQAQQLLEQRTGGAAADHQLTLRCGEWSGVLPGDAAAVGGFAEVEQAYRQGRTFFLSQGWEYLAHLAGMGSQVELSLAFTQAGQAQMDALLSQAQAHVGDGVVQPQWAVEGDALLLTKGRTGTAIDHEQAKSQALTALGQMMGTGQVQGELALPAQQTAPQPLDLAAIRQEICVEAKDAEMEEETFQITDHVVGVDFAVAQAQQTFDAAAEGETVSVPLQITQPQLTRERLDQLLFADLLGEGTSRVSGSANRKHNVKLSATACNGIILLPGQEFSYNNTTGSRTAAAGYLNAPAYVGGKSVDEMGGGICQTSSTIYYAVLHTSLEVVERHNHQFAVGYVPDGMDATVWFGSLDFRFRNNTPYPIKLVTESYDKGGSRFLAVKIYGTKTDDITIKPERVSGDFVTKPVTYLPDPSVPLGKTVEEQSAYTGRKATVTQYYYDKDGALIKKVGLGTSSYKAREAIVRYNPQDAASLGLPSTGTGGTGGTTGGGTVTKPTDPGSTVPPTDPGNTAPPTDPGTQTPPEGGADTGGGDSELPPEPPIAQPPTDGFADPNRPA